MDGSAFSLTVGVCLAGVALTGCARSTPPPVPAPPSASRAKTQNWDRALNQLWSAWQKASASKTAPTAKSAAVSARPLVTIDLNALAARHPAWQLARALEENRISTLDFAALRAAGVATPHLDAPHFDVSFAREASTSVIPDGKSTPALAEGHERAAETVTAHGLEALATQAGDHQSDEVENFLRAAGARQTDARQQYAQIRRAALENTVEAVRAAPLPALMPPLLSDAEQLTVTNLRLQLLDNVFSTEEERARAQAQLDKILADWHARLRAQEKARAAELQRRLVEEPQRAREAGEADLRRDLAQLRREQRAVLQLVWRQHQARVHQDFGNEAARLGIVLPAASLPAPASDGASTPPSPPATENAPNFIETNLPPLSSVAVFGAVGAPRNASVAASAMRIPVGSAERAAVIRALRAQAWREARKEAQWAARRFGWRWQPAARRASATDRTREVLQWLSD
jgi:hypothetical protein